MSAPRKMAGSQDRQLLAKADIAVCDLIAL